MAVDDDRRFFRHKTRPAWGVGVLVEETSDHRTFLFADGSRRAFKLDLCDAFIEPAEPPTDEDQARLSRGRATGGKATPKAINLELEAQILAAPDDPAAYLVYADWLQTKQDPRGALITLQHQLATTKDDKDAKRLLDGEKKLLDDHGHYLMPESLHAMLRRRGKASESDREQCRATWRLGFLHHVFLAKRPRQQGDIDVIVQDLLHHPSSHFLRGLTVGALGTPDQYSYVSVIAALSRVKHPLLRELVIGDFPSSVMELAFTHTGNVSPLFPSLPALKRLSLRAGSIRFESNVKHAALEHLSIEASELSATALQRICRGVVPELRSLEIACPSLELGPESLRGLFGQNAKGMPKLERLSLGQCVGTGALFEALLASPLLGTLDTLEIVGDLTNDDVTLIVRHASRLAHLKTFDVRPGTRLSDASARQLAALQRPAARSREAGPLDTPIREAEVARRASDARSMTAARAIATPEKWLLLGRDPDGDRFWGEFEGQDHYYVLARVGSPETSCSCASPRDPCKHALALLLLAATNHPFDTRPVPPELVRQTRDRPRYAPIWE